MRIETLDQLAALYGPVQKSSQTKVAHRVTPEYARLVAASPFTVLATVGPEGLDRPPRGDQSGFVRLPDDRAWPERAQSSLW